MERRDVDGQNGEYRPQANPRWTIGPLEVTDQRIWWDIVVARTPDSIIMPYLLMHVDLREMVGEVPLNVMEPITVRLQNAVYDDPIEIGPIRIDAIDLANIRVRAMTPTSIVAAYADLPRDLQALVLAEPRNPQTPVLVHLIQPEAPQIIREISSDESDNTDESVHDNEPGGL